MPLPSFHVLLTPHPAALPTDGHIAARDARNPTPTNPYPNEFYGGWILFAYLSNNICILRRRYPVADDASIRDGLMHEFVGLANKDSQESLRGPEAMRGQALSCSLFACIAIGGLMAGCPPAAVAPHMATAQATLSKFGGLSDVYAVRAFVLYAMASEFLGGLGPGTEYRKGMEAARAVFENLPAKEKEPVLSAVLSHFMVLEGLPLLQHVETSALTGGGGGGGGGGGPGLGGSAGNRSVAAARERNSGTSYVCCKTAHEEATFQKALATRADVSLVMAPHPPPAYVVADGEYSECRKKEAFKC